MRRNGWDVLGVELNDETASYARETYGITVKTGNALSWDIPEGSLDAVTLNHVLEHVDDPLEMLSVCRKLLKKGGLLVIAVPDIDSLQAKAGKEVWFHLDIPHHLYHFSERGLRNLLKKNALRVVKTRRFDLEYNIYGWLQTLLNLSGIRKDFLFSMLKTSALRNIHAANYRKRDVVLTGVLAPVYLPLSVVLSLIESFVMRHGGTVEVYAVKEE
jgi:SAM-dependent methyltransferase